MTSPDPVSPAIDPRLWSPIAAGATPSAALVSEVLSPRAVTLGRRGVERLTAAVTSHVVGAGPLEELLTREDVTDVLVNGPGPVWVDRGAGLERSAILLSTAEEARSLAVRLAGSAGRRLDDASPFVDGLLPGGVRIHAALPPLVDGGAHISLRIPRRIRPTLAELEAWGSLHPDLTALLRAVVSRRCAVIISGGTGSGKTTLLGALLAEVDHGERLLVVEDTRELLIDHPHVVHLSGRPANVEGAGAVDLVTLVRQSLRMRPDRLVVGEVRGAEVRELLAAMNTGHEGGAGTVHANAPSDVIARFEALGALAGMSPEAVRLQFASAVQVVVHVRRDGRHRRVEQVGWVARSGHAVEVLPAVTWRAGCLQAGPGWPGLSRLLDLGEGNDLRDLGSLGDLGGPS